MGKTLLSTVLKYTATLKILFEENDFIVRNIFKGSIVFCVVTLLTNCKEHLQP